MKICYISREYPVETRHGGIAAYTYHTARCMAALGHEVYVITCVPGDKQETVEDRGVKVLLVPAGSRNLPFRPSLYPYRLLIKLFAVRYLDTAAWARSAARAFSELDKKVKFDIVEYPETNGEGYFVDSQTCRRIVRLHMSFPLLCRFNLVKLRYWDRRLMSFSEKASVMRAHAVVCPSKAYRDVAALLWRIPHERITILPNPLHIDEFPCDQSGDRRIFTVPARLEPNKGIHNMIKFFGFYQSDFSNIRLKFAGRFTDLYKKGYLEKLVASQGIKNRVEFSGHLDTESLKKTIKDSLAVFIPSTWENMPYSCLESMAMGRVVFGTVNGGVKEIIKNGKNGFLADFTDLNSVKEKLDKIMNDPDLRGEIERRARETVEQKFSAAVLGPQYEAYYKSVLNQPASKS
jgi:glycosyltransferase involved in cell wall biosynthesis